MGVDSEADIEGGVEIRVTHELHGPSNSFPAKIVLPNPEYLPAPGLQASSLSAIALDVSLQFPVPVFAVGFGAPVAFLAPVPEATVDEYRDPPAEKHEIRPPFNVLSVQSIATNSGSPQCAAERQLGRRILATHASHGLRSKSS